MNLFSTTANSLSLRTCYVQIIEMLQSTEYWYYSVIVIYYGAMVFVCAV